MDFNLRMEAAVTGDGHDIRRAGATVIVGTGAEATALPALLAALATTVAGPEASVADIDTLLPGLSESPALTMLRLYLGILRDQAVLATGELQRLAAAHVKDLLAAALGAARDAAESAAGRSVRAARRRAIKADVGENLDAELSVTGVAARHRVTPRYVQKLFEDEGTTFTQFVLAQRLERARRMLADPRLAARSITSIAFDVGFGDLSYFNRTFRQRFGDTPSGLRAAARAEARQQ